MQEECSQYGQVQKVVIYQEKQSNAPNAESVVKIFVEFSEPEGCESAKAELGGRFFSAGFEIGKRGRKLTFSDLPFLNMNEWVITYATFVSGAELF